MIFIIIVIMFIALILIRNMKIDILNPAILYLCIWTTILILYNLNVFRLFPKLNTTFYIVFFSSIVFFIVGTQFPKVIKVSSGYVEYDFKKLFSVNLFLLFIVFGSFIITFIILGKPPILGGTIDRSEYYIGPVEIFYFLIYVFWFLSFYLISNKFKVKENYLLILLSLAIVILKGNKFPFVYLISIIVYFLALKRTFKIKHILNTIIILVLMFFFASFTYMDSSNTDIMYYKVISTGSILTNSIWFLNDPLLYLTNNFMNLNNFLVNSSFEHTYGLRLFQGFLHNFRLENLFSDKIELFNTNWKGNLQYPWLTTATYLKDVYSDFGPFGIIIGPFIFGLISGYLKKKVQAHQIHASLISLYLFHIFFFSIIMSFFTQYLTSNEILTNLLVLLLISIYVRKKGGRRTNA